jgi:hypothetical protein
MSIIQGNAHTSAGGGYQIERSLRFNSADTAYLNRTPGSAGNRKTWTWSGWIKRSGLAAFQGLFGAGTTSPAYDSLRFTDTDTLQFFTGGAVTVTLATSAVFRDPSAWYHVVLALDTTQATNTNRVKLYVNNIQQTLTGTYPNQNTDWNINNTITHSIGAMYVTSPSLYFNGYMTEVNFIDGQALTPSSFGETDTNTGVWKPKAYSGTYGTNGFELNFSDNSNTTAATLGKDSSGNGNNWTPNNFSVTAGAGNDSLVDSPTSYGTDAGVGGEVRGNYCTVNPLDKLSTVTLTNGNLDIATGSGNGGARGTIAVTSGKWYWEVTPTDVTGGAAIGIWDTSEALSGNVGSTAKSWSYWSNGQKQNNNSQTSYGASYTTNDVIGVALDMDAGTVTFYKNNSSQGTAFSSLSGTIAAGFGDTAGFGCLGVDGAGLVPGFVFGGATAGSAAPSAFLPNNICFFSETNSINSDFLIIFILQIYTFYFILSIYFF